MTRRWFVFAPTLIALGGQSALFDLLERVSSALSEGDLATFLSCFDPSTPHYEQIAADAKGLMEQNNVSSTIEVISETDGAAEVDWTLTMKARAVAAVTSERRKNVKLTWKPHRRSARFTSIDPPGWFAPPTLG
jgi:hypothetical protein